MTIIVFGSINMDLVVRVLSLPAPGQTLTGHVFETVPGGKGANQAVACARLGIETCMIGRVGDDPFAETLRTGLQSEGVDTASVLTSEDVSSGVALITVSANGENTIIVVPGANATLDAADIEHLKTRLPAADAVLLQLEVPLEMTLAAARAAQAQGVFTILDPAPAQTLPDELYTLVDVITPNETEAAALVGFLIDDENSARKAAEELLKRGAKSAVIKMGSKGAYWRHGAEEGFLPAYKVDAVDTVAAGDAFNAGLATALSLGHPFHEALRWAMAAGALATTRKGAQPAMPTRGEVLALLSQ